MKRILLCAAVLVMFIGVVAGCHHEVEPAHDATLIMLDS